MTSRLTYMRPFHINTIAGAGPTPDVLNLHTAGRRLGMAVPPAPGVRGLWLQF